MKKKLIAVAAATASILASSIAASSATAPTLTIGISGDITSFATSASVFANAAPYYQAVYDTLLRMTPEGTLVPGLAQSWRWNGGNTALTLKLRKHVTFTDGTPFDADAVVANLLHFKASPKTSSVDFAKVASVTATDAQTVVIGLSAPNPALPNYLALNDGLMESPKNFGSANEARNPVGTGPYILDTNNTTFGSSYVFKANPNYWDAANRPFSQLTIKVVSDSAATLNALKAGQIEGAKVLDNGTIPNLKASGFNMSQINLDWSGIILADRNGALGTPLKNVLVRQAINYAFDRTSILQAVNAGYGVVTNQVINPHSVGFDANLNNTYPYDPAKAKALLTQAGYPDGFSIKMAAMSSYDGQAVNAIVQQELGAVGIKVQIDDLAPAQWGPAVLSGKYPLYFRNLQMDLNPWQAINFLIPAAATWNVDHYTDPNVTRLVNRIQHVSAGSTQTSLMKQLNEYIVNQAWYAPWYVRTVTYAYSNAIVAPAQAGNAVPFLYNIKPAA